MPRAAGENRLVRLQITCTVPPAYPAEFADVELGMQDRQLNVHPGQQRPDGSLLYEIEVTALCQSDSSAVTWRGPYIHGAPAAPFLYLSLRRRSAEAANWLKRLKIPLPDLSWEQIVRTSAHPCFAVTISGQGSGTVPLLGEGWS